MVRAHPTVPLFTPLNGCSDLDRGDTRAVVASSTPACESSAIHPQFRQTLGWGDLMRIFQARHFQLGLFLAVALSVSVGPAAAQSYTAEQQQACTGDAFRLCSSDIPDVDRVTACMIRNKAQLSPQCRAHFRRGPEPSEAAARPAGRPTVIRPASPRQAVSAKARKIKKPAKPAST